MRADGTRVYDFPGRLDVLGPVEDRDEAERLMRKLAPRERKIVLRHFFAELSMRAVAAEFGLSESRICQLIGAASDKMRLVADGIGRKLDTALAARAGGVK